MVIKKLMDRNILASINQTLDSKLATEMAREFGASTNTITYEEESQQKVEVAEEQKDLLKRAPVDVYKRQRPLRVRARPAKCPGQVAAASG